MLSKIASYFRGISFLSDELDAAKESIAELFKDTIIPTLLWVIAIVLVIVVIMIGLKFATTEQPEERQKLKTRLIWVAVGIGLCILAQPLVDLIFSIFEGVSW